METGPAVELGRFAVVSLDCSSAVRMMTAFSVMMEICSLQE